jgi:RNA polymerase sigma-70 factor (ECF subfamily)
MEEPSPMSWPRARAARACPPQATEAESLPDDAALVAAARRERRAFALLYRRYADRVYRYCYARLGSREAAEDATSETFTRALAALDRYRDQSFAAWLFRIAHNVVIDLQRRRRPTAPLDAANERHDPGRAPDEIAIARDAGARVRAALAQLPEEQRAAVELPYAGWSGQQIAEILGRSPDAVKMLRYRAITRLRGLLTAAGMQPEEASHDPR